MSNNIESTTNMQSSDNVMNKKDIDSNLAGHIVESMVNFDFRLLCEKENYKQFYYRNSKKEEIDLIIDRNIDIIPIEIKYTNQIESSDLKAINKFIEEHHDKGINQTKFGIVVTKDILKKEGKLYFIPYWLLNIG